MRRLAILSDIHGNLPTLEAVLDEPAQFKVDHVIVPDDVISWASLDAGCTTSTSATVCE